MSERATCSNCGKRRVVAQFWHVGGTMLGLIFPSCRACLDAGWKPQEGRDYWKGEDSDEG
jgi:hypothetical protein